MPEFNREQALREFAQVQMDLANETGEDYDVLKLIHFEHDGSAIIDLYTSSCGRFELKDPTDEYPATLVAVWEREALARIQSSK